jgi:tol-pal system protein YbgF
MKGYLLATVICSSISGACFAQAPVVDVAQSNTATINPVVEAQTIQQPVTVSDLESRLAIIERISQSRTDTQQRMQQQLDMLQSDVDSIRGSIELHNHQLEKILERQRELFLELDRRFESLQQQSSNIAGSISPSVSSGGPAQQTGTSNVQSEQEAYQSAVDLILKDRDYESAVPAFRTFLASYPSSALTDNAHYWLGQLLYNSQDWEGAREQFTQVVERFKDSPKRADSILKLGMIAKNNGNANLAREYFQQVVSEYPNSTPARLSSEQLSNG